MLLLGSAITPRRLPLPEKNVLPPIQDIQKLLAVGAETDGAVTLTYPIPAVPHRGRYPLEIRLEYTSTVENGLAGVGWTITNEYIEQVGESYFWVRGSVRHELREDQSTPGVYRGHEATDRRALTLHTEKGDDGPVQNWEAADELGVTWRYAAQLVVDWGGVVGRRWYLMRVEDSNGNYARFSYVGEEISSARRPLPLLIDEKLDEAVVGFFNQVETADEIVETIEDNPDFGSDSPRAYGVRQSLARRMIAVRAARPGNQFTSITQIAAIPGVGPDTLHDIIWSITGQDTGEMSLFRFESVPFASIPGPYLDTITYNDHGDTAHNRLRFVWHDRDDTYYDHIGDVALICTKILSVVHAESLVDGGYELHRNVQLAHIVSDQTGRNLLYMLAEHAPSGGASSIHLSYTRPSTGAFADPSVLRILALLGTTMVFPTMWRAAPEVPRLARRLCVHQRPRIRCRDS